LIERDSKITNATVRWTVARDGLTERNNNRRPFLDDDANESRHSDQARQFLSENWRDCFYSWFML